MKIEDQSFKFDFHVIPSKCFRISLCSYQKVRLNRAHIHNIPNKFHVPGQPDLSCYLLNCKSPACIYHVSCNLSPASRALAFTLVYSGLTSVASALRISGALNLIIILSGYQLLPPVGVLPYFYFMPYLFMYFSFVINVDEGVRHASRGECHGMFWNCPYLRLTLLH